MAVRNKKQIGIQLANPPPILNSMWAELEKLCRGRWSEYGQFQDLASEVARIMMETAHVDYAKIWNNGSAFAEYLSYDSQNEFKAQIDLVKTENLLSIQANKNDDEFEKLLGQIKLEDARQLLLDLGSKRLLSGLEVAQGLKEDLGLVDAEPERINRWLFGAVRSMGRIMAMFAVRREEGWTSELRGFFSVVLDLLSNNLLSAELRERQIVESKRSAMFKHFMEDFSLARLLDSIESFLGPMFKKMVYVHYYQDTEGTIAMATSGGGSLSSSGGSKESLPSVAEGQQQSVPQIIKLAFRQRSPFYVEDLRESAVCRDLVSYLSSLEIVSPQSGHFFPLLNESGEVIGVLSLFSREGFACGAAIPRRFNIACEILSSALQTLANERVKEEMREGAIRAANMKSKFLAMMNHELRTPLSAMIGYVDALTTGDIPVRDLMESLAKISRNGNHLMMLLNDILDLGRMEAGMMPINLEYVEPRQLMVDVVEMLQPLADRRGVVLEVKLEVPPNTRILTDPLRLKQIIFNLVGNAIKFARPSVSLAPMAFKSAQSIPHLRIMKDGRPDVLLKVEANLREKAFYVSVTDNGPGITPEELGYIFKPYHQLNNKTNANSVGSGLGLAISKELALLLKGDIEVESERGIGSTFKLCLTGSASAEEPIGERNASVASEHKTIETVNSRGVHEEIVENPDRFSNCRILLVDDSEDSLEIHRLLFKKLGITVDTVNDGQEAVARALGGSYEMILMDMEMPRMNGLEACKKLRSHGYKVPIVALTAHTSEEQHRNALDAGCNKVLQKPFTKAEMFQVMNALLLQENEEEGPILSELDVLSSEMFEVLDKFITNLPVRSQNLKNALAENNWHDVQAIAHQLSGVGSAYGYPQISREARVLEGEVGRKNYEVAIKCSSSLLHTIDRVVAARDLPGGMLKAPPTWLNGDTKPEG